jgi:hypothetical protein
MRPAGKARRPRILGVSAVQISSRNPLSALELFEESAGDACGACDTSQSAVQVNRRPTPVGRGLAPLVAP